MAVPSALKPVLPWGSVLESTDELGKFTTKSKMLGSAWGSVWRIWVLALACGALPGICFKSSMYETCCLERIHPECWVLSCQCPSWLQSGPGLLKPQHSGCLVFCGVGSQSLPSEPLPQNLFLDYLSSLSSKFLGDCAGCLVYRFFPAQWLELSVHICWMSEWISMTRICVV